MERNGNARTESQNCLKTSWTQFYTYILVYRYKQVIVTNWRLKSRKLARRRQAWQAWPSARDPESEAGLEISSYVPTLNVFLLSPWPVCFSSAGFSPRWKDDAWKMQIWILVSNSSEVSPNAKYFAIYLLVLRNPTVHKCCLDVLDRPRFMRNIFALTLHLGGLKVSRAKSWFLPPALWDAIIHPKREKYSFHLYGSYSYVPCLRLCGSPWCTPLQLKTSWCSSALHFNSADIFPAEFPISSWISSPLVPRNE